VALVSCHTNLDRAPEGADALPAMLGLRCIAPLEDPAARQGAPGPDAPAMGRLCEAPECADLRELAATVGDKLGVRPRVWGDPAAPMGLVAVAPGSGRSLVPFALSARASAIVTGELRYHVAQEASGKGLSIVEAGHDATEWPLARSLAAIATATPRLPDGAVVFDERATRSWWTA
jgi:putative NIF3 family GTP cyclohydrolase 1 type 2